MSRRENRVVDSSEVMSILIEEEGCRHLNTYLDLFDHIWIGAPTLVEIYILMITKFENTGMERLLRFLKRIEAEVVPFNRMHFMEAAEAYRRFGKGRHPARLNLGDCHSYAVAKLMDAPLLYKGNDFAQTDLPRLT